MTGATPIQSSADVPASGTEASNLRVYYVGLILLWLLGLAYATQGDLRGDEYVHFVQVQRFILSDFRVMGDALTTIPGYHCLLAAAMAALGQDSLGVARALSGVAVLLAVVGFARLHRAIQRDTDPIAVAQFALLPLMAPYAFLVYTDVASLAAVLWCAYAAFRGRHLRAAGLILVAILMRQNNVLWIGLFGVQLAWPIWRSDGVAAWRRVLRQGWPYLLPLGGFVGYWLWNGSVSYSNTQASMHPDARLHVENLYFMLFCAAILLPLHALQGLRRFAQAVRTRPSLLLVPVLLLLVYFTAFAVDHPYNLGEPAVSWRNRVLQLTNASTSFKFVFGLVGCSAALGLGAQNLAQPVARAIYPFIAIFVMLSWLVEQRYFLIPLALFLAWRTPLSRRIEVTTLALWAILAVFLFWGMISGSWYL